MESLSNPLAEPLAATNGRETLALAHVRDRSRRSPAGAELFGDEVERAVERAGGREAVEERATGLRHARRGDRRSSFEEHRSADEPRPGSELRERGTASVAPESAAPRPAPAPGKAPEASATPAPPAAPEGAATPSLQPANAGSSTELPAPPQAPPAAPAPATVAQAGPATLGAATAVRAGTAAVGEAAPLAQSATPRTAAARAVAQTHTPPTTDPVQLAEAAELLRQVRLAMHPGLRNVRLELQPAELGRLSIHLALRGGRITAVMRADSERTLGLLESQAPELRAALAQNGIEADALELELGFGSRSASHGAAGETRDAFKSTRSESLRAPADIPEDRPAAVLPARGVLGDAGIDTYA